MRVALFAWEVPKNCKRPPRAPLNVPPSLVKELSQNRAGAVKEALVNKYHLDPNQFNVEGMGWDRPADPADSMNHAKNRRVEIKVYPAEAAGT